MSATTRIAWATSTGSPWFGCTEVSPGCKNCYARELTRLRKWAGWGDNSPRVRSRSFWAMARRLNRNALDPRAADMRPRMFPSLMDWLDPKAQTELLAEFLDLIRTTPNLNWLLLTKRPESFESRLSAVMDAEPAAKFDLYQFLGEWLCGKPPGNVWLGVSVEDQQRAVQRIPVLLTLPARVRFVSAEPLLEPIDFTRACQERQNALSPTFQGKIGDTRIDWVIVGGESGPKRRHCGTQAIVDVASQCKQAGVPVFVKQGCALRPGQQGGIPDYVWAMKGFPITRDT